MPLLPNWCHLINIQQYNHARPCCAENIVFRQRLSSFLQSLLLFMFHYPHEVREQEIREWFHILLMKSKPKYFEIEVFSFYFNDQIRSQFGTCHEMSHSINTYHTSFGPYTHKIFMEWSVHTLLMPPQPKWHPGKVMSSFRCNRIRREIGVSVHHI